MCACACVLGLNTHLLPTRLWLHSAVGVMVELKLPPLWLPSLLLSVGAGLLMGSSRQERGRGASWEQSAEVNMPPSVSYIMAGAAQRYHPHYSEIKRLNHSGIIQQGLFKDADVGDPSSPTSEHWLGSGYSPESRC